MERQQPNVPGHRAAELEQIKQTYDAYAQAGRGRLWHQSSPGYARLIRDLDRILHRELAQSLTARDGVVVDLGCGSGDLATVGLPMAGRWIGVDLRADAIAAARAAYPGATFIEASADATPLDTRSVDVVVARVLFSSLPSAELEHAVAMEVARILRPGGWLVWQDIRYDNPWNRAVHGISARRLEQLFPRWERSLHADGLLPPLARRLGPTTPILYPILKALPPLRSHLVGRLQRRIDVDG